MSSAKQLLRTSPRTAKRLFKVFIGLLFLFADQILKLVKSLVGIPSSGTTIVIYYHQVSRDQRDRFAMQMDHLLRWAKPVRAENLDASEPQSRRVVVTADDGWQSFVENALPELEQRNIPSTLFVVSHRLGDKFGDPADRLISEAELLSLRRDLVTVGSHTATHPRLTVVSEARVRRELLESRARLSDLLQVDANLFCFPFSEYDRKSVKLCRSAGYIRAFGSQSNPLPRGTDTFLVERVRVDPTDWPIEFHLKLMNAYRGVFVAATLRRKARKAIRTALLRPKSPSEPRTLHQYHEKVDAEHYSDAST